jgi:hypothetical protein
MQAILYVNLCTDFVYNIICSLVAGEMVLSKNTHILETGYSFCLKFFFFFFMGVGHYPVSDFKRMCPPF